MTIDVAFMPSTHTSFDVRRYEGFKKYRFICTYPFIKVGDVITSPDYSSRMIVTEVYPKDERTTHCGITLKTINISTVNIHKSQREDINNPTEMDKRTVCINLCQAREWYKSGNAALRKVALTAFTEEELEGMSYEQIMKEIAPATDCSCLYYPSKDFKEIQALIRLRNIAYYLNNGWERGVPNTGFFLVPNTHSALGYNIEEQMYGWAVIKHVSVKYPGVIYFKSKEAAVKALKIAYKEGWLKDME